MSSGVRPPAPELRVGDEPRREGWTVEPFVEGNAADYAALRALLARAEYTEPVLCARYGIAHLGAFALRRDERGDDAPPEDAGALLTRLFLDSQAVAWTTLHALLTAEELALLERLGLLHTPRGETARCRATVLLYPMQGLWLTSDLNSDPDGGDGPPPVDVVYPAISEGTQRFVQLMPRERCDAFLELCSGTGVAALIAARDFATHAWAVDLTARATRFARFNAALNGIENFTALAGDLWAPVAGLTFDRIVAHPPYMPAFETQYVFRDGGEDGEQVTRRILAGLSTFLREGGRCFCSCMASDRAEAPLEERVRAMLGPAGDEYDLVIVQAQTHEPLTFYSMQARAGRIDWPSVGRWKTAFDAMGITQLVVCSMLLVRRGADGEAPVTMRRRLGAATVAGDLAWQLDRAAHARVGALGAAPDRLRPRTVRQTTIRADRRLLAEGWTPGDCEITTTAPFAVQMETPPWVAALLSRCDGDTAVPALLRGLQDEALVPTAATLEEFVPMVLRLIHFGVVEVAEWPHAARTWDGTD